MSQENGKPWQKPWATEEIVDNAQNWSLAGDAALLKTLEAFSNNLFDKVSKTNENLNCLHDNLNKASLRLDITKNEFLGLQNRQFVESRVYEDDETAAIEGANETVIKTNENEDEITNDIRKFIVMGLDVFDKYYDQVEVSVSDSEDDTEMPNYVITLKDPYIERPLPLVIGTDEWYKKWHAGLKESSSESESDKSSEKFSDTDSETDLPISNRAKLQDISDSSSEGDLKVNSSNNAVSSTCNDTVTSSSEEGGSVPIRAPISSNSFAEQLAAKLGSVIDSQEEVINKKPIQKTNADARKFGGLFFDEPPPLDEEDNGLFDKKPSQGIFSSDKGFFSDEEDESIPKAKIQDIAPKDDENFFSGDSSKPESDVLKKAIEDTLRKEISSSNKTTSGGLFEDDDEEEGLFSTNILKSDTKKTFLPAKTTSVPFYNDEPPEIDTAPEDKKKKPTGGVSIFGTSNLFGSENITDVLKKRTQDTVKDSNPQNTAKTNENNGKIVAEKQPIIKSEKKPKTLSLFDDDDLFEDDLFSNVTPKKFTSNLFGDSPPTGNIFGKDTTDFKGSKSTPINTEIVHVSPNEIKSETASSVEIKSQTADIRDSFSEKSSLFGNETAKSSGLFDNLSVTSNTEEIIQEKTANKEIDEVSKANQPKQKVASLFDDFNDDEDDLFSNIKIGDKFKKPIIEEDNVKTETVKSNFGSTFGNVPDDEKENLFEDQKSGANIFNNTEKIDNLEKEIKSDLFDDAYSKDDDDDLFSSLRIPKKLSESASEEKSESITKPPVISLFDPTPPPDEDDWDTKSEKDLFDEDILTNKPSDSFTSQKSSFLDEEPPLLNPDDAEYNLFQNETKNDEQKMESYKSAPIGENTECLKEAKNKIDITEDVVEKKPPILEKFQKEIGKKEDVPEENSPKKPLPGKLKLNLNINVGALMPGAAPPKRELVKSQSLEASTPERENKLGFSSSEANVNRTENSEDLFDNVSAENVSTLRSVTKDRAKIPVKRRPSTRKARREQIRNSVTDFTLDPSAANLPIGIPTDAITSVETKEPDTRKDEISSEIPVSNPVEAEIDSKVKSVKTDEEIQELFTKAGGDYLENKFDKDKNDMSTTKEVKTSKKLSLFDSPDSDDDDDIFKPKESAKIVKKPPAKVVTANLFDDDDGLFGSRKPTVKTDNFASPEFKSDIFEDDTDDIFSSKKLPPKSDMIKKSLFDDDGDDDDIFGASSATPTFVPARPPLEGRSSKPSVVRKLNPTELSEDPLDALKK